MHLSDLHFGYDKDATARAQRAQALDLLVTELCRLEARWRPQILVISGDLTWKGRPPGTPNLMNGSRISLFPVLHSGGDAARRAQLPGRRARTRRHPVHLRQFRLVLPRLEKLAAYGEQAMALGEHEVWSNVEYLKVAILDALDEVRAGYLVHLPAVDAVVERNRITGVIVSTKRGLMAIRAKAVVDCTGDTDVTYFASAETMTDPDKADADDPGADPDQHPPAGDRNRRHRCRAARWNAQAPPDHLRIPGGQAGGPL